MHVLHNCLHSESTLCEGSGIGLELAKPWSTRICSPTDPEQFADALFRPRGTGDSTQLLLQRIADIVDADDGI